MNMLLPPFPRRHAPFAPVGFLLLLALAPSMAVAEDARVAPQTQPVPVPASAFADPLAVDALDTLRGGDQVVNVVDIHGTVEGNTAEDVVTGDNHVLGGAFGNAAGINTLIQNTGANVLIQSGMTVNVQFADPGAP